MSKRILFDNRETCSRLRNGLVKTIGVEIADLRFPSIQTRTEEDGVLLIQAVNSRQNTATGYVEIPFQESVLRQLADYFQVLACEASGVDIEAQTNGLLRVIDHQIESQSMAHEDLVNMLDEMMYQLMGDDAASGINNQGIEAQLKVIATHAWKENLFGKLVIEGIWGRDVIDPIYETGYERAKAA